MTREEAIEVITWAARDHVEIMAKMKNPGVVERAYMKMVNEAIKRVRAKKMERT
jgi:hypothetical protein